MAETQIIVKNGGVRIKSGCGILITYQKLQEDLKFNAEETRTKQ